MSSARRARAEAIGLPGAGSAVGAVRRGSGTEHPAAAAVTARAAARTVLRRGGVCKAWPLRSSVHGKTDVRAAGLCPGCPSEGYPKKISKMMRPDVESEILATTGG
ncbi:hypothetical protein GCM10010275_31480 [Streptomyces litmocidini]|nr:hypothetical protein GCM10010275_31480 [Streptomyces litmocidini]